MKTKNILAALLLMASTTVLADEYKSLTITHNSTEDNISLPLVQKISFADGYMVVATTSGTYSYPLSTVERITFTDNADAIQALPEQAEDLTFEDGTLRIKGDGMLSIYNTGGALVSIANVKEGANVSLEGLPTGVYIVRMGDKVIKVKK